MSNIRDFYFLTKEARRAEEDLTYAKRTLDSVYPELVKICPHPEAIQLDSGGDTGPTRICVSCGVIDRSHYGSDPGDEYDYGHAGRPDPRFWVDTRVIMAGNKEELDKYRKSHYFQVKDGEAWSVSTGSL